MNLKMIYEPKGRAKEYSNLALNIYKGCEHGCVYCYAPQVLKKKRDQFHKITEPRYPDKILDYVEKDAHKLENTNNSVLLCFTSDPYQPINDKYQFTGKIIDILNKHGLGANILTKGGKRCKQDLDKLANYPNMNKYGATLVFKDDEKSLKYEPKAAPTSERINILKEAHDKGIHTWVSLEPVWSKDDALELIKQTHQFVNLFRIGKMNYHEQKKNVDWYEFKHDVCQLLDQLNCKYALKDDLLNL